VQNKVCVGNSFCSAGSCACATSYTLVGKMCVLAAVVVDTSANLTTPAPSNETTPAPTDASTHSPVPVPVPAVVPETLAEALKIPDPSFEVNPSKLVELKSAAINYLPVVPAPVFNQFVAKPFIKASVPIGLPLLNPAVPLLNPVVPLLNPAHLMNHAPAPNHALVNHVALMNAANQLNLLNSAPLPFLANQPLSAFNYLGPLSSSYYARASPNAQQYIVRPNQRLYPNLPGPIFNAASVNPYFNFANNYLNNFPFYPFTQKKT